MMLNKSFYQKAERVAQHISVLILLISVMASLLISFVQRGFVKGHSFFSLFVPQLFTSLLVSFLLCYIVKKIVTKHLITHYSFIRNPEAKSMNNEIDDFFKSISQMRAELDKTHKEHDLINKELNLLNKELNLINKELEENVEIKTQIILEQRKKLEYASRMASLGEMAAGIAHEINNPLMIFKTATNHLKKALADSDQDGKLTNYFEKMDKTTDRMSKIVLGLLSISKDASSEEFTKFTLEDVITDVLELSGEKFKLQDLCLNIDFSAPGFKRMLFGRRTLYNQIFFNLLNNAYDSVEKCAEKWIKIEAFLQDKMLYVHITDSGKGIPLEAQEKMMQTFFTTKEFANGAGLGLSASLGIIKDINGKYYIDTSSGNTTFVIALALEV